jgi:hypothetical protein
LKRSKKSPFLPPYVFAQNFGNFEKNMRGGGTKLSFLDPALDFLSIPLSVPLWPYIPSPNFWSCNLFSSKNLDHPRNFWILPLYPPRNFFENMDPLCSRHGDGMYLTHFSKQLRQFLSIFRNPNGKIKMSIYILFYR